MNRPIIQTTNSAGADLLSAQDIIIQPGATVSVQTQYVYDLDSAALVLGRSGLAFNKGVVCSHVGLIDADYRGCISVLISNTGSTPFYIYPGDRIAQLVVIKTDTAAHFETKDQARVGGFGSTGNEE